MIEQIVIDSEGVLLLMSPVSCLSGRAGDQLMTMMTAQAFRMVEVTR